MNEPLRTYARPPFFNFRIALTPFSGNLNVNRRPNGASRINVRSSP